MKTVTKICIAALVMIKIVLGSVFVYRIEPGRFSFENKAMASETEPVVSEAAPVGKDAHEEETIDLDFLIRKRTELDAQ